MKKSKHLLTDKARQKTDIRLKDIEQMISRVYESDPALLHVYKEYKDYMNIVDKKTSDLFLKYQNEKDKEKKEELKSEYTSKVRELTVESKQYQKIISKFVEAMADANQKMLDIVNAELIDIYVDNYNAVADECERVGIKVNGKDKS